MIRPLSPATLTRSKENKPYNNYLQQWGLSMHRIPISPSPIVIQSNVWAGTTSVQAADKDGWVVSVTPSGVGYRLASPVKQVSA